MAMKLGRGDKKKALLAYKEKLLQEVSYYEQRIDETRLSVNKCTSFENDESSDSDTGLPQLLDSGPSIFQLQSQQVMLKTCLQATQELAGLELLQHEMNILTKPPKIEGEPPIKEDGTWQEVTAECCVDLVPFSITFYTFRADRKFAPLLYRGLKVLPLKGPHEAELMNSVLPELQRPSDAVEVLRSYAVAYRSRRATMARLADRFAAALHMEPLAEGGYLLKCADMLEVCWTLQNRWSPIVPFHHKLKFDIEYIDEQYIKPITQAHRQLSDPTVDTDERTLLMAKIISTCLQTKPLADSQTEVGQEPAKDSEVMAPPRSLPKKVKTKNKENRPSNQKTTKRPAQQETNIDTAKKPKTTELRRLPINDEEIEMDMNNEEKINNETVKSTKSVASERNSEKNVAQIKNKPEKSVASVENLDSEKNSQKNVGDTKKNAEKSVASKGVALTKNKSETGVVSVKNVDGTNKNEEARAVDKVTENTKKKFKESYKSNVANKKVNSKGENVSDNAELNKHKTNTIQGEKENRKSVASAKNNNLINVDTATTSKASDKTVKTTKKSVENQDFVKKIVQSKGSKENLVKNIQGVNNEKVNKILKTVASHPKVVTSSTGRIDKDSNNTELDKNVAPKSAKEKTVKSIASAKITNLKLSNTNFKKTASNIVNIDQTKKAVTENNVKVTKPTNTTETKLTKVLAKPKVPTIATKLKMPGNTEKENALVNKLKVSKIPQKKVTTPKLIKKMPLRVSPRKPLTKPKSPLVGAGANMKSIIQKPVTRVPRLMAKPNQRTT